MNWMRVLLGGLAAGIATTIADFVMHGQIMANTYQRYSTVFSQEQANPAWFAVVEICVAIALAILFGKSRASWARGVKGGVVFGVLVGLVGFFTQFYMPLVIDGFPYYLAWCWGGINMIDSVIAGAVLGAVIPSA